MKSGPQAFIDRQIWLLIIVEQFLSEAILSPEQKSDKGLRSRALSAVE